MERWEETELSAGDIEKVPEIPIIPEVAATGLGGDSAPLHRCAAGPVVRLELTLQAEDGGRVEATLAIPAERYDGLRVLELFERHRMAGTTRIVTIRELEPEPLA